MRWRHEWREGLPGVRVTRTDIVRMLLEGALSSPDCRAARHHGSDRTGPEAMSNPTEPPTLAMVVEAWLEETHLRVDLAANTVGTYVRVGKHLKAWGKDLAVVGIVRMAGYVILRREAGIAPRTIALELRVASAAFNWAQREGIVGQDARLRLPRLKIDPNRFVLNHRTPTPGEAARVIEAMPERRVEAGDAHPRQNRRPGGRGGGTAEV